MLDLEERNVEKLKPFILVDPSKNQKEEVEEEVKETDGKDKTYVEKEEKKSTVE